MPLELDRAGDVLLNADGGVLPRADWQRSAGNQSRQITLFIVSPSQAMASLEPQESKTPMTTSTPPPPASSVSIPLKQLVDNPDNPRRQFDVTDLKELADSIRAIGVVEPIIVRPNGKGTSIFEIIAGHRRSRAAALAGLAAIPAIVKDLSDDQALEVALVENLQRKDLHPLDEAACFGAMRGRLKLTAAQIAAKCHRPEGYVASRLKLLVLSEAARKEFAKGTFGIGVANELARVEDRGAQEKALKGDPWGDPRARRHLAAGRARHHRGEPSVAFGKRAVRHHGSGARRRSGAQ